MTTAKRIILIVLMLYIASVFWRATFDFDPSGTYESGLFWSHFGGVTFSFFFGLGEIVALLILLFDILILVFYRFVFRENFSRAFWIASPFALLNGSVVPFAEKYWGLLHTWGYPAGGPPYTNINIVIALYYISLIIALLTIPVLMIIDVVKARRSILSPKNAQAES